MSGLYIPGMEMPKSCHECVAGYGGCCFVAPAESDGICPDHGRADFCPLVPVPDHGRLIDADVLIDAIIAKYIRHERNRELVFAAAEIKQDLADIINELPTIISAEEGEA